MPTDHAAEPALSLGRTADDASRAAAGHDDPTAGGAPLTAESLRLPLTDPWLAEGGHDLDALAAHWSEYARRPAMTAEEMRGADRRAQRLGTTGERLMEQAGAAVAAAARALLVHTGRTDHGPVLVLAGAGNNGGDGSVAARHLARSGIRTAVVLVATEPHPSTRDALTNWERLEAIRGVDRLRAATARDVSSLMHGLERASLVVDALLGTGIRGTLREPVLSAVEIVLRARSLGVPILAVDTPTAVDLSSGMPSDPVVRAHVTITFHRPKAGLLSRTGAALAGRVLVAPIGIPPEADLTWR